MVRAGESSGALEGTLRRLAALLEETQALRDALVSALIYPALLTGVGAAAVVFLMTFVIPRFAEIFRELGGAIPAPTLALLAVADALGRYWWLLGLGTLAVLVGREDAGHAPGTARRRPARPAAPGPPWRGAGKTKRPVSPACSARCSRAVSRSSPPWRW